MYAMFWVCVAVAVSVTVVSCVGKTKVSDETAKANAEACSSLGKEPRIEILPSKTTISCKD